jgi:DNA repair exonuclease SbcCD nuclease subunit
VKFTVVGDPHCRLDNLDKMNQLFDMIEDLGNDCIILGDLLDTKELIRGKCLNLYLKRMRNSKLFFSVLVGNHDRFALDSEEHALQALGHLSNVRLVNSPRGLYTDEDEHGKFLAMVPYIHDPKKLREALESVKKADIIFCHADIKGFDYGNGLLSKEGLDLEDLAHYPMIVSGHYHKYQKLNNITYLGTPFSHSFGESNQDKYLGILDTDTMELELLETPFPRHKTITIDASQTKNHPGIDLYHYNRIILTGKPEDLKQFPRLPGIKYIEKPELTKLSKEINEVQSPEVQFNQWASEVKKYNNDIIDLGLRILKNV